MQRDFGQWRMVAGNGGLHLPDLMRKGGSVGRSRASLWYNCTWLSQVTWFSLGSYCAYLPRPRSSSFLIFPARVVGLVVYYIPNSETLFEILKGRCSNIGFSTNGCYGYRRVCHVSLVELVVFAVTVHYGKKLYCLETIFRRVYRLWNSALFKIDKISVNSCLSFV